MEKVIQELFKAIPQFLISFFTLIGSPRQFPINKLPKNENEKLSRLTEALTFVMIAYVIIVLLSALKKGHLKLEMIEIGTNAVVILIRITFSGFAFYLGWLTFGTKQAFIKYFIIYSYQFGLVFLLYSIGGVISDGFIKTFDLELFKKLIEIKETKKWDSHILENNVFIVGLTIDLLTIIMCSIWTLCSWGAYRIINNVSRLKSLVILFVTGIYSWLAVGLGMLVISGLSYTSK
ncbi:hypothetical protein IM792_09220 [Mucilaginibacter sp. JRF]|uniref:hypothetical protein n=1 Tax=Mucilaginibacter sp. JRF TaxID=2780088 RepID=UPI001880323A|nr:hypothetical protein [Mucilaginibacter sp. JRF]MBE9584624.1 hypothetical protein [Mucilaginibacter sp. JRF]